VPNLKGKKPKAAKKRAKGADCAIGKVKKLIGATTSTGKVVSQSPKAVKTVPSGTKISVKLR
jgi:beta-lactam-binding protein with PASTA domain